MKPSDAVLLLILFAFLGIFLYFQYGGVDERPAALASSSPEALLLACSSNDLDRVREILKAGADPNRVLPKRRLPLHIAATNNNPPIMLALLEKGARIDMVDSLGAAPLHLAVLSGATSAIRFLLDLGAHPDVPYSEAVNFSLTPRYNCYTLAIARRNMIRSDLEKRARWRDSIRTLLDAGVDPGLTDPEGMAAAHAAAAAGDLEVLEDLHKAGAPLDQMDRQGLTPLARAVQMNQSEIVELLKSYGISK